MAEQHEIRMQIKKLNKELEYSYEPIKIRKIQNQLLALWTKLLELRKQTALQLA